MKAIARDSLLIASISLKNTKLSPNLNPVGLRRINSTGFMELTGRVFVQPNVH